MFSNRFGRLGNPATAMIDRRGIWRSIDDRFGGGVDSPEVVLGRGPRRRLARSRQGLRTSSIWPHNGGNWRPCEDAFDWPQIWSQTA